MDVSRSVACAQEMRYSQLGTNATCYLVHSICAKSRQQVEDVYTPCFGEICGVNDPDPSLTREECLTRRVNKVAIIYTYLAWFVYGPKDCVYVRLPISAKIQNIPVSQIRCKARVIVSS